jgi:hypothetical protein
MSQVLLCHECGHQLQENGEKCVIRGCQCPCLQATFHRPLVESRELESAKGEKGIRVLQSQPRVFECPYCKAPHSCKETEENNFGWGHECGHCGKWFRELEAREISKDRGP